MSCLYLLDYFFKKEHKSMEIVMEAVGKKSESLSISYSLKNNRQNQVAFITMVF